MNKSFVTALWLSIVENEINMVATQKLVWNN